MKDPMPKTLFCRFKACHQFSYDTTNPENGVVDKTDTASQSFPIVLNSIADPFGTFAAVVDPFVAKMADFYGKYQVHKAIVVVRANLEEGTKGLLYWSLPSRTITSAQADTDTVTNLCKIRNVKLHGKSERSTDIGKHAQKRYTRVIKIKNYKNKDNVADPNGLIGQTMTSDPAELVYLHCGYSTLLGGVMTKETADNFIVEVIQYATLSIRDNDT